MNSQRGVSQPLTATAAPLAVRVRGRILVIISAQNGTVYALDGLDGSTLGSKGANTSRRDSRNQRYAEPSRKIYVRCLCLENRVGAPTTSRSDNQPQNRQAGAPPPHSKNLVQPRQAMMAVLWCSTLRPRYLRAALVNAGRKHNSKGMLYVSFGNSSDIQPWHGWLFELDLDAWAARGVAAAINAVLLSTPESSCGIPGESGSSDMICGGGIWTLSAAGSKDTR